MPMFLQELEKTLEAMLGFLLLVPASPGLCSLEDGCQELFNVGFCEEQGKYSKLKANTCMLGTECYDKPKSARVLLVVAFYCRSRSDKAAKENLERVERFLEDYKALKAARYSYADIKRITNDFKEILDGGEELRLKIQEAEDAEIAKKLAIVGFWCIQWHPMDRPSMKTEVQMLEGEGNIFAMPQNPFASAGAGRMNANMASRQLHHDLVAIPEGE
uniref:Uncharacterized protein n=1 Tax=Populus alba TaxID=43335 RepID=A0A4U5R0Y7_POPAL|nr:hypothetical protein D5086_0000014370 [Populus alba]